MPHQTHRVNTQQGQLRPCIFDLKTLFDSRSMRFSSGMESRFQQQITEWEMATRGGSLRTLPRRGASRSRRSRGRQRTAPTGACQGFTNVSKAETTFKTFRTFNFLAGELCEKYFSSKHNMERHQKKIHNIPIAGAASGAQPVKEESG